MEREGEENAAFDGYFVPSIRFGIITDLSVFKE